MEQRLLQIMCFWAYPSLEWLCMQVKQMTKYCKAGYSHFLLLNNTDVFSFLILYTTKHRYIPSSSIPGLFSGSFWQITTLNVAIFRRATLPSAYWFQIELQYFHSSISVCRCRAWHSSAHMPHTLTGTHRNVHSYTHTSCLSLVVNNVLMAILRLLTHSQPINQTIQLAYDHNKYALDECLAVRRIDPKLPRSWDWKDKCDRKQIRWSWGIYTSSIFVLWKSVLISALISAQVVHTNSDPADSLTVCWWSLSAAHA